MEPEKGLSQLWSLKEYTLFQGKSSLKGTKDQTVPSLMEKSHTVHHLDVEDLEPSVKEE